VHGVAHEHDGPLRPAAPEQVDPKAVVQVALLDGLGGGRVEHVVDLRGPPLVQLLEVRDHIAPLLARGLLLARLVRGRVGVRVRVRVGVRVRVRLRVRVRVRVRLRLRLRVRGDATWR